MQIIVVICKLAKYAMSTEQNAQNHYSFYDTIFEQNYWTQCLIRVCNSLFA